MVRSDEAKGKRGGTYVTRFRLAAPSGGTPRHGASPADLRVHNERLVLDLLRSRGPLSRIDLARSAGLSPQAASDIAGALEQAHLIRRLAPRRGRVGQPSVPLELDPDGAYFGGLRIGRRGAGLMVLDLTGKVRFTLETRYPLPMPEDVMTWAGQAVEAATQALAPHADRLSGLGVALPFRLWDWNGTDGTAPGQLDGWRYLDVAAELAGRTGHLVQVHNDATAACAAELMFGATPMPADSLHFYVGTFIGGGIVMGGQLIEGASGNAGAVGSLLVPGDDGEPVQLIERASLIVLERRLAAVGADPTGALADAAGIEAHADMVEAWLDAAAPAIGHAVLAASALVACTAAVIDGPFPADLRDRLVSRVEQALAKLPSAGLDPPRVLAGTIGPSSRAMGAAGLVWHRMFRAGLD